MNQFHGKSHQRLVEKLRLVDPHHVDCFQCCEQRRTQPLHIAHRLRLDRLRTVRSNRIRLVAQIDVGFKTGNTQTCDLRALQPPDQFFALAGIGPVITSMRPGCLF